jgi:hypothetical protein
MARGRKRKSTAKSFGDFKKSQNEKRLDRIISEGKKSYASQNRGQSGGLSSIPSQGKKDAFVGLQRQKFFGDRDIPEERVLRRTRQEGGIDQFKQALIDKGRVLKDSKGNVVLNANTGEPVFLTDVPGGRSVSDVAQDLAFRFGPTPSEVAGDIGYGLGQIAKAYGIPVVSTAQRIGGGLKDLYDYLFKKPTVTYGGRSDITVTEEPIQTAPQFPYNFETVIKPKPLTNEILPTNLNDEDFDNTYPFLPERTVESDNPLFNQQNFEPVRVSDMNMSGVMASNVGQNIIGNLQNLQNLAQQYNLNKIQFDPFNPNRIGYKDQFMFNNTPVNYNIGIGDQGLQGGIQFAFKRGGSVDKHGGLGYKLK